MSVLMILGKMFGFFGDYNKRTWINEDALVL